MGRTSLYYSPSIHIFSKFLGFFPLWSLNIKHVIDELMVLKKKFPRGTTLSYYQEFFVRSSFLINDVVNSYMQMEKNSSFR